MKKVWVACLTMVFLVAGFGMVQASDVSYQEPANIQNQVYYLATEQIADQDTVIGLPPIEYQMDLVIEPNEDFTLVFDLGSDGEFTVDPAINVSGSYNSGGTANNAAVLTCSKRRGGAGDSEIAYACNLSDGNSITNQNQANIRIVNANFNSHALNANGVSGTIELGVWDWTENARVDYSSNQTLTFTTKMASGFGNVTTTASLPQDLETTIDATLDPPLTGFVATGTDVQNTANGNLFFTGWKLANDDDNTIARNIDDANMAYNLVAGDEVEFTVTDDELFTGLTNLNIVTAGGNEKAFTVDAANGTATVDVVGTEFGAFGHNVAYHVDGTTVLGTGRTLGASAVLDPASGGADITYSGSNAAWWVWDSNGTVLQTPLFNMPGSPWVPNFVLTNTGGTDADFTIGLLREDGTTITPGTVTSGTIPAGGTLVLPVSTVVDSITGGVARGTATFTVSAAPQNITGLYQLVNPTSGSISNHIMGQVAGGAIQR